MIARNYLSALVILTSAAFSSACGRGEASVASAEESPREIPVEVRPAVLGTARASHAGTAHLEAEGEARVTARVAGEVVRILIAEGERVEAGQLLARLDGERHRLSMEMAAAELEKVRQTYRRNVALHERGLVSQGAFENLRFDMEALESEWRLAKLQYDYTAIRSPIDGVVSTREVTLGSTVREGDVLFRVTNLDQLRAYVHVPQRDLARFSPGQAATLHMAAWPGEGFEASVLRISPTVDAASGTARLTLTVPSSDGRLRPGMFGKLEIVYEVREDALLVPEEAILDDDETSVFVVTDGQARRRDVKTGLSSDGQVQVVAGLAPGDAVIVVGQSGLKDGAPVTVRGNAREI